MATFSVRNDERQRAVQAALGHTPFDLLLTHANLIDMVTGEIRLVDIGIVGPLIASVHPCGTLPTADRKSVV